jgi:hypothetical protein
MIPSPESFFNFIQGGFGVASSQIHRHLARECNIRGAPFTGHIRESNIKMFGHLLLNLINSDRLLGSILGRQRAFSGGIFSHVQYTIRWPEADRAFK